MIRLEQLTKTFMDGERTIPVLDDLSMRIPRGKFVALLGRSGSGKSTLLNCIAGLERPDHGRIFIGETELTQLSDDALTALRRARIGIVFQFFNLLPVLTIEENVALPALLDGHARSEVLVRARALLAELGLEDRRQARPEQLSGGEQQRVATARALINDPLVVLADEPTGNLDAATAETTLALMRQVNEKHGVTILMATHSRHAAGIADFVVSLTRGRVAAPSESESA
ncbi:MAG TPA: ABC transporter ATP-binding protein [Candidatus Krumholzibacteria bacterium]|jgi:putative ABC transport system ATP-binding protein